MRTLLAVVAALAPIAFGQTTSATFSYSGNPVRVFPDEAEIITYVSVYVPRSVSITDVTIGTQVQFSGVGDLNIYVYSPNGTRAKLLERNCGSLVNVDTTFADSAPTKYADFCPTEAGRGPYRSNEPLSNFRGQNSMGIWRLAVENNGSDRTGFLTGFTVTINGSPAGGAMIVPQSIVSSSSFKGGAVAPGELLTIFGVNLGPTTPVTASGSPLPMSLAESSVTFNGVAVPIAYASNQGVVVQAPYNLTEGSFPSIQVRSTFGATPTIPMPVVSAKPGIFTYQAGPEGQAKAVNQDGSLNGDPLVTPNSKPAPIGSIIQLFVSGLGPVAPAVPEGTASPSNPLSLATLPVSATIGGSPATITYAGLAPGQIGIFQVNLMVPVRTRAGAVPIVLNVNGNSSQDGATVQIQ